MSEQRVESAREGRLIVPMIIVGLLLCLCLVACVFLLSVSPHLTIPGPQGSLPVHVCAGVTVNPRFQIGFSWVSPLSSYAPPLMMSPYAVCVSVPTLQMPRKLRGGWLFPP